MNTKLLQRRNKDREIVITGKELSDELDKINKPTKLRVLTE